jgi:hypothetical protein
MLAASSKMYIAWDYISQEEMTGYRDLLTRAGFSTVLSSTFPIKDAPGVPKKANRGVKQHVVIQPTMILESILQIAHFHEEQIHLARDPKRARMVQIVQPQKEIVTSVHIKRKSINISESVPFF